MDALVGVSGASGNGPSSFWEQEHRGEPEDPLFEGALEPSAAGRVHEVSCEQPAHPDACVHDIHLKVPPLLPHCFNGRGARR